jgi:hypothetical protein
VVSFAFWLVNHALEDRHRRREAHADRRHMDIIEHLSRGAAARAEASDGKPSKGDRSI